MEMRLYIARHAHAEPSADDEIRPLSAKGRKQMERLRKGFAQSAFLRPEVVWHSGLVRAEETARELIEGLDLKVPLIQKGGLTPYDNPHLIVESINQSRQSTLIVGHNPNLSELARLLIDPQLGQDPIAFLKGSILCLSRFVAGSQHTPWQIEWHISHHFFK